MEPDEADVKPTIPTSDAPNKNPLTAAPGVGKLKQSRYEDVWPEDVHAAFMEAVALYPPMGKRRLKYYRITQESDHFSDAHQAKSFGRCQLIQSYILEKTGKNRSRKQVSSHLQRLKKIHKDNPAMNPLFSEYSQPPSEHVGAMASQDTFANISFSTRHLKTDLDLVLNPQNVDKGWNSLVDSPPTFSYASQPSSFPGSLCNAFDLSTNFYNQPPSFSPQELLPLRLEQYPAGTLDSSDSDHFSEFQDPLLSTDTLNGTRTSSAINTSAPVFSVSMRCFASKQSRQMDPEPMTHFSRAAHSPGFQPTHQCGSHDGLMDSISCNSLHTTVQSAFRVPFHHFQLVSPEKQRSDPGPAYDWLWPQTLGTPLGPREGDSGEVYAQARYPTTMYQYNPTNPLVKIGSSWPCGSLSESEVLRLPRGMSYSYAAATPMTVSGDGPGFKENTNDFRDRHFPGQVISEYLASPPMIKPTPVYPVSYIHSDVCTEGRRQTPNPL